jgi:hypothetical protein
VSPLNESGQLIWTTRLTFIVSGAAGLIGVSAVVAGLLGGAGLAGIMGMISGVALFVAISGRLTTKRSERWANAATPPSDIRVRRNRVVIRRRDVASLIMFVLCAAGTIVVVLSNAGSPSASAVALAGIAPMTVFFALASFASRTVVTADELIVDTMFRRRLIPRRVVGELRRTDQGAVRIAVVGQPHEILMPTGTNSLFIRGSWDYRPAEVQALGCLRTALDAVPPGPGGSDRVLIRRRFATIALAILAAGAFLTDVVLLVTHQLPG